MYQLVHSDILPHLSYSRLIKTKFTVTNMILYKFKNKMLKKFKIRSLKFESFHVEMFQSCNFHSYWNNISKEILILNWYVQFDDRKCNHRSVIYYSILLSRIYLMRINTTNILNIKSKFERYK